MENSNKPKPLSEIQMEEFLRELDTPEGRQRIGDDAYREAKEAEKRKSIEPRPSNHQH